MVLYTGKRPYNYSLDLSNLFENQKSLARALYKSPYHLIDLSHVSDEELDRYGWVRVAALFLKHIHDEDMIPFLKGVMGELRKLEKCGEFRYIDLCMSYMIETGNVLNKDKFRRVIANGLTCIDEDKIMIIGEQFRREGFEEGIKLSEQLKKQGFELGIKQGLQQGVEKGAEEKALSIAKNMIAENISLDLIVKLTGVSMRQLKRFKH